MQRKFINGDVIRTISTYTIECSVAVESTEIRYLLTSILYTMQGIIINPRFNYNVQCSNKYIPIYIIKLYTYTYYNLFIYKNLGTWL